MTSMMQKPSCLLGFARDNLAFASPPKIVVYSISQAFGLPDPQSYLEVPWVVISGVISRVTIVITHINPSHTWRFMGRYVG